MRADAQVIGVDAVLNVPLVPGAYPLFVQFHVRAGAHEVLHLHLLELTGAEDEVAWCDLVAEGLTLLGDAEWQLAAHRLLYVEEVDEDTLRGLGAQVGDGGVFLDGADKGLEHQVELAYGGELATAVGAAVAL